MTSEAMVAPPKVCEHPPELRHFHYIDAGGPRVRREERCGDRSGLSGCGHRVGLVVLTYEEYKDDLEEARPGTVAGRPACSLCQGKGEVGFVDIAGFGVTHVQPIATCDRCGGRGTERPDFEAAALKLAAAVATLKGLSPYLDRALARFNEAVRW